MQKDTTDVTIQASLGNRGNATTTNINRSMIRAKLGRQPGFDSGFAQSKAQVFAQMMVTKRPRYGSAMTMTTTDPVPAMFITSETKIETEIEKSTSITTTDGSRCECRKRQCKKRKTNGISIKITKTLVRMIAENGSFMNDPYLIERVKNCLASNISIKSSKKKLSIIKNITNPININHLGKTRMTSEQSSNHNKTMTSEQSPDHRTPKEGKLYCFIVIGKKRRKIRQYSIIINNGNNQGDSISFLKRIADKAKTLKYNLNELNH
jgi:hypothetical protein